MRRKPTTRRDAGAGRWIVAVRAGVEKLRARAESRADGTLWSSGCPILDGEAACGLSRAEIAALAKARRWADIPSAAYAKMGANPSGLHVLSAEDWDARERAAYEASLSEGERAYRRDVESLEREVEAARRADYCDPARIYGAEAARDAAREAWAERYPADALRRKAAHLRARAEHERELAAGALTYDADGSLGPEDQERRSREFGAKAAALDAEAVDLLTRAAGMGA